MREKPQRTQSPWLQLDRGNVRDAAIFSLILFMVTSDKQFLKSRFVFTESLAQIVYVFFEWRRIFSFWSWF